MCLFSFDCFQGFPFIFGFQQFMTYLDNFFLCMYPAGHLLILDLIFPNIFAPFSLLFVWDSNYIPIRLLDIVPKITRDQLKFFSSL